MKRVVVLIFVLLLSGWCEYVVAQLPNCNSNSHVFYYLSAPTTGSPAIYTYDPTQPVVTGVNPTLNAIVPPAGASGLTISNNLNGAGPSPTFYVAENGNYLYYNGTTWVNTGHTTGSLFGAVNPGGGTAYIFNMDVVFGEISRYNGTGNATTILNIPFLSNVADISVDCNDDFYILFNGSPQKMEKYDMNGNLLITYTVNGIPQNTGGGGLAVFGSDVYFDDGNDLYHGVISGTTVNFTYLTPAFSGGIADFASCAMGISVPVNANIDTAYYCGTGPGVQLQAPASGGPFTWSVISGQASITGSGNNVSVIATSTARILLSTAGSGCNGGGTDTVTIIVPMANLDAGLPETVFGCFTFIDTLHGSLTNTTTGVSYNINWSPAGSIVSGGNTLQPIINPSTNTVFTITASTPANQGGCIWKDSVAISVAPQTATTATSTNICPGTSVQFGSQLITSTGTYAETFQTINGCDSVVTLSVNLIEAPAQVSFDINNICTGIATNVSIEEEQDNQYTWDFGTAAVTYNGEQSYTLTWQDTGIKVVSVLVSNQCGSVSYTDTVSVSGSPNAQILPASFSNLCGNDTISLAAQEDANITYQWYVNRNMLIDGSVVTFVPVEGYVTLTATNGAGCKATDSVYVEIDPCCIMALPTAFTPNQDGRNDIYRIITLGYNELEFFGIVNRFGEIVFQTKDLTKGWDGKYKGQLADVGTYYYLLRYKCVNNEVKEKKGDLILIR